jgi:hypothetical protein
MNKWDTIVLNNGLKCMLLGEETMQGISTGILLVKHKNEEFVCNIDDVANHIPYTSSKNNLNNRERRGDDQY